MCCHLTVCLPRAFSLLLLKTCFHQILDILLVTDPKLEEILLPDYKGESLEAIAY